MPIYLSDRLGASWLDFIVHDAWIPIPNRRDDSTGSLKIVQTSRIFPWLNGSRKSKVALELIFISPSSDLAVKFDWWDDSSIGGLTVVSADLSERSGVAFLVLEGAQQARVSVSNFKDIEVSVSADGSLI